VAAFKRMRARWKKPKATAEDFAVRAGCRRDGWRSSPTATDPEAIKTMFVFKPIVAASVEEADRIVAASADPARLRRTGSRRG